jgi:hypothetical protein
LNRTRRKRSAGEWKVDLDITNRRYHDLSGEKKKKDEEVKNRRNRTWEER